MKKGFLIFIISYVFVSTAFDSALADDPKRNSGTYSYIDMKGNLYCALKVPSADSLYQENLAICVTKDGYIASTEEALLDQAVLLASLGDEHAFSRFLDENPSVFFLKGNLLAKIEKRSWPGKVKIMRMPIVKSTGVYLPLIRKCYPSKNCPYFHLTHPFQFFNKPSTETTIPH